MKWDSRVAVSTVTFLRFHSVNSTAVFTSWQWEPLDASVTDREQEDAAGYSYAWEDLHDISTSISAWDGDGVPPSVAALESAAMVMNQTSHILPAPEISTLDNGTILLFWHMREGFASLELGSTAYGLLATREGFPSLRQNGASDKILSALPKRDQFRPRPVWSVSGSAETVLAWGIQGLRQLGSVSASVTSGSGSEQVALTV